MQVVSCPIHELHGASFAVYNKFNGAGQYTPSAPATLPQPWCHLKALLQAHQVRCCAAALSLSGCMVSRPYRRISTSSDTQTIGSTWSGWSLGLCWSIPSIRCSLVILCTILRLKNQDKWGWDPRRGVSMWVIISMAIIWFVYNHTDKHSIDWNYRFHLPVVSLSFIQ